MSEPKLGTCDSYKEPHVLEAACDNWKPTPATETAAAPTRCGRSFVKSSDGMCANCSAPESVHIDGMEARETGVALQEPDSSKGLRQTDIKLPPIYYIRRIADLEAQLSAALEREKDKDAQYLAAVGGRSDFRTAFREAKEERDQFAETLVNIQADIASVVARAEQAEAESNRLREAILDHISDGHHTGPRSERLRAALTPPSPKEKP